MRRRRLRTPVISLALVAAVTAAVAAASACGHVVAPPPPATAPEFTRDTVVAGQPIVIAAKSARALYNFSYQTRRFGQDSTWGYRSQENVSIRLRYVSPERDSTRVLAEVWGCGGDRRCLGALVRVLFNALTQEEAPPG